MTASRWKLDHGGYTARWGGYRITFTDPAADGSRLYVAHRPGGGMIVIGRAQNADEFRRTCEIHKETGNYNGHTDYPEGAICANPSTASA